jgi:DNA-binding LacI/PurR family transcriptional regulator
MLLAMTKRRRPTAAKMSDIANAAGVHVSTVSRALAGSSLVAEPLRERILKVAHERNYVVNSMARNLRLQRTQTISVAIPLGHEAVQTLTDPFFVELLAFLADEITQRGHSMLLKKVLPPMSGWLDRLIGARQADGIIVVGQSTEHEALEAAAATFKPLVVWGGHLKQQSYCTVGTDNVAGARAVVEHLIKRGRRRIVFLGDPSIPEIRLRQLGYREALKHAPRGPLPPRTVPARLTMEAAYEATRAFIDGKIEFDAVFGATDVIAVSAIRALRAAGLEVPKDIAVVGYDDISLAAHCSPTLTTVRQDLARGSKMMVELLFRRLEGMDAPSATMPADVIVRESSGP